MITLVSFEHAKSQLSEVKGVHPGGQRQAAHVPPAPLAPLQPAAGVPARGTLRESGLLTRSLVAVSVQQSWPQSLAEADYKWGLPRMEENKSAKALDFSRLLLKSSDSSHTFFICCCWLLHRKKKRVNSSYSKYTVVHLYNNVSIIP